MKTTTAWAHLPNAKHIDWVMKDVDMWPEEWAAVGQEADEVVTHAAWDAAVRASRDVSKRAGRDAAWDVAWAAVWGSARWAVATLIAWDDCAALLDMPVDAVKTLAAAGHHPAVLLLPVVIVRSRRCQEAVSES